MKIEASNKKLKIFNFNGSIKEEIASSDISSIKLDEQNKRVVINKNVPFTAFKGPITKSSNSMLHLYEDEFTKAVELF